jgi:zinc/manganese transport system permease protein
MIEHTFIDYWLLLAPLAAGAIILLTHVPLGIQVIKRGIIFIDLAIAQIASLGVIVASLLGLTAGSWQLQLVALSSALIGGALLGKLEQIAGKYQEALIGVMFILAATASIILLSSNPHAHEQLQNLLIGQILWVDYPALLYPGVISLLILVACWLQPQLLSGKYFFLLFALAITSSVQLIGVYLVFASLIIPALAVVHNKYNLALVTAYSIGILGYFLGLWLSSITDLPSGAVIVWSMSIISLSYWCLKRIIKQ